MSREDYKLHNYGDKIYLGIDLGTSSVGWAVTDEIIVLEGRKEKTYGESACLMKQSRVLKEEPIGLQEEEDNEKKQEYRC